MPVYRFEFREDLARETVDGVFLHDDRAARAEAVRTAREILAEGVFEGLDRTGWVARVHDEAGRLVAIIPFADLLERRGNLE